MPVSCCIKSCKNIWRKNNEIQFHRFPFKNKKCMKYWIMATGRNNWVPYSDARICSLHFINNDYYNNKEHVQKRFLKPDVIPTQNVHANILQLFQQDTVNKIDKYNQNNGSTDEKQKKLILPDDEDKSSPPDTELPNISPDTEQNLLILPEEKQDLLKFNRGHDLLTPSNEEVNQLTSPNKEQELVNEYNNNGIIAAISKCSKCANYNQTLVEIEKLKKVIEDFKNLEQKQLNQQASMFHTIINNKEAVWKKKLNIVTSKNKILNKSIQRRNMRITNLKTLLKVLRKKNILDNDVTCKLENEFGNLLVPLLKDERRNKDKSSYGRRYSEEVKRFAITMHYHSPKAYEYCRTIFKLPHSSSIRNWTSAVDAQPGFQTQILGALKELKDEDKDCCLIFDAMAIRQQLLWSEQENKYIGFCDYGNNINIESKDSESTEALVFMLVCLRGVWKWPIAYFLKHSISAMILAELIKTALTLTAEVGVRIRAITCDGDSTNCSALQILGANIFVENYKNIKNYFQHVTMKYKVRVLLDPCHMIKLARNAIADYKEFKHNETVIKWEHITQLHTLQNELTLKLKNRLSSQCIQWKQNKMKVKYAAHTLSSSVANAIEFLKKEGFEHFKDSEGTITFIRIIDKLFDFLNSRSPFSKGFKKPITPNDVPHLRKLIEESTTYLFSLQNREGKPLRCTARKTFIYGIAIAAKSVLDVAEDLFVENKSYKYVLTYKFSQDHVELLFSKIRSRHGFNNNPNVLQFRNAMRQLLLHNDIKHSTNSNCTELDTNVSGSIFQIMWTKNSKSIFNDVTYDEEMSDNESTIRGSMPISPSITKLNEYIIYYLSGYIVKKLSNITCYSCALSLRKSHVEHNYSHTATFTKFLDFCNNGGLISPSNCVFKICMEAEKQLDFVTDGYTDLCIKFLNLKVITIIKNKFALDSSVFPNLQCDNVNITDIPHKIQLITAIISKYIKIRLHTYSKFYLQEILKPIRKRHTLTKQILFYRE